MPSSCNGASQTFPGFDWPQQTLLKAVSSTYPVCVSYIFWISGDPQNVRYQKCIWLVICADTWTHGKSMFLYIAERWWHHS